MAQLPAELLALEFICSEMEPFFDPGKGSLIPEEVSAACPMYRREGQEVAGKARIEGPTN